MAPSNTPKIRENKLQSAKLTKINWGGCFYVNFYDICRKFIILNFIHMKRILFFLLLIITCIYGSAQSRFVTTANLNMRRLPCTCSEVMAVIPRDSQIQVLNYEDNEWARVRWNNHTYYVSRKYIKSYTKSTSSYNTYGTIRYYTNSRGERVQSPTYYQTAPAGATALCSDGTYSFSRSRRGTCSHHGGVARWL